MTLPRKPSFAVNSTDVHCVSLPGTTLGLQQKFAPIFIFPSFPPAGLPQSPWRTYLTSLLPDDLARLVSLTRLATTCRAYTPRAMSIWGSKYMPKTYLQLFLTLYQAGAGIGNQYPQSHKHRCVLVPANFRALLTRALQMKPPQNVR